MEALSRRVAATPEGWLSRHLHSFLFSRGFDSDGGQRLLILFEPNRISYASVFPFLHYADVFASRFGAQIRLAPTQKAIDHGLPKGLTEPTAVLAQAWLTDPAKRHVALARLLKNLPAGTVTGFLDSFANADIRLAALLPGVDLYFKKSLFRDASEFQRPTYGHTNLTEYYGRRYNLPDEMTDWQVPSSILPKLRLAPHFLTAPDLSVALLGAPEVPSPGGRDIDLHARLGGTAAEGWYGEMRRQAAAAVDALAEPVTAVGSGLPRDAFQQELRRAKICFSPFGYGEVCWRDIEAIVAGAVLLKPDMSHLRTEPDLYEDGVTYVSCAWDFSDVAEKVQTLLADPERRARIAGAAWRRARDYLRGEGPVETYAPIFEAAVRRGTT
jgi:hypothetical protein